jgi:Flp pilus assembly protein TadD
MLRLARQASEPAAPPAGPLASEVKAMTAAAPAAEPPAAALEPPVAAVEASGHAEVALKSVREEEAVSEPAETAAVPQASSEPETPAHQPGMMAAEAQIEHLLLEGSVKMTVSDYANAVTTYSRLVDLAPKVANYRVRLAIAMALWPKTSKHAEREFVEAIRLDPNNADIHYQFGLYYKAMRVRSRAIAEFRTAVSLSPRHKQARAELEALSPKDSALTSLKKFFR